MSRLRFFVGIFTVLSALNATNLMYSQDLSNTYIYLNEYQGILPDHLAVYDRYFENALLPTLNRLGVESVGVLSRAQPLEDGTTSILVVMALKDPSEVPKLMTSVAADADFRKSAKEYLEVDPTTPIFSRVRGELLLAFNAFPELKVPMQTAAKKDRLFELRIYESPTELRGHLKVEMFNSGEVDIFADCGIQPVFMGQAIIGDKLPNLTYMTVYDDAAQKDQCWKKFQQHPDWQVLKVEKKYATTVSKIHKIDFLPRPYSQL